MPPRGRRFQRPRPWHAFALLALLALAARLAFIAATPGYEPIRDDWRYDRVACAIAVAGAYPVEGPDISPRSCGDFGPAGPGEASAFRPPGWPVFLAGVYVATSPVTDDRRLMGRLANALLGALGVLLLGLLALRVAGRRVALLSMGAAALYPPLIVVGGSLVSETLFACLMLGAVLAGLEGRRRPERAWLWTAGAGGLVGLAALTRPNALVLLLPLALAVSPRPWLRPGTIARAAALTLAAVLVIAPWTVRNHRALGEFIPVSNHLGEWLAGTYNDDVMNRDVFRGAWRPPGHLRAFSDIDRDAMTEAERQRELLARGTAHMAEHPGHIVEASARNSLRMLYLDGEGWWRGSAGSISLPDWGAHAGRIAFVPIALLALAGALTPAARRVPGWLWLVPALIWLSTIPSGSEIRYRTAVEPFLILLAALAAAWAWRRLRGARAGPEGGDRRPAGE